MMAKSCEVTAFQCCFSLLQEGLQHELTTIAPALFAENLISSENRDKCLSREPPLHGSTLLLSVLESRIRIDPASFYPIIGVLDSCPTLQVTVTKLRSELERIKGEREEQQELPHEVSTEEIHGARSTNMSSQPACDGPTAIVQKQIHSLEDDFANLVMKLICVLTVLERESDNFVDKVHAAVLALPLSLKDQHHLFLRSHRKELRRASNVTDILNCLCSYWNYLNVSLFGYMVKKFGGDELKAEFEVYMGHLKDFRQNTKLGDFIDALRGDKATLPPEFVEVQITFGTSWENRTLEDAEEFRLQQCGKAQIAEYGSYLTGGKRKCIILTWGVAEMAVSSLLSVLDDAMQRECDIVAIDYTAAATGFDTLSAAEHTDETHLTTEVSKDQGAEYDYDFVAPDSQCSVCLKTLQDPHLVSCCEHNICGTCISQIQRDCKPCPLCKQTGFTTMANESLKQTLINSRVCCPHRELGCEWVGELGKLDQHLNTDPQPEHQLEGCQFTSIECIHCKDHMRRHVIADHQNEDCPKLKGHTHVSFVKSMSQHVKMWPTTGKSASATYCCVLTTVNHRGLVSNVRIWSIT